MNGTYKVKYLSCFSSSLSSIYPCILANFILFKFCLLNFIMHFLLWCSASMVSVCLLYYVVYRSSFENQLPMVTWYSWLRRGAISSNSNFEPCGSFLGNCQNWCATRHRTYFQMYEDLASHDPNNDFIPNQSCFEGIYTFQNKSLFHIISDSSTDTSHSGVFTFLNLSLRFYNIGFSL
jgi:hypothetical protein